MSSAQTEVVVVGTGVSGLCAALTLGRRGCRVVVLEKQATFGGNGKWALTGINLCNTPFQESRNITDSAVLFKRDILRTGLGENDPSLVDILVGGVQSARDLLTDLGITLSDVVNSGGHTVSRTHKPPNWPTGSKPMGQLLVDQLLGELQNLSNVQMETEAEASSLIMGETGRDRAVRGVVYTNLRTGAECTIHANAVVLATGGYISDRTDSSLLAEASAQLCSMPTSCGAHADGRGINMARDAGAELVDMAYLQVDPCGIINQKSPSSMRKDLCPSLIRSAGALLVNGQGRRFCNELDSTQKMTAALVKECGVHKTRLESGEEQPVAYLLINMAVLSHVEQDGASVLQHPDAGQSFGSVRDFCHAKGIPVENIQDTFIKYTLSAAHGSDEFGKHTFPATRFSLEDPLWMLEVTPVLHHSNGGIKVNGSSEVVCTREDGTASVLIGLYAAGECTGGVHGAERLSGNGLLDSIVFGSNAGRRAADSVRLGEAETAVDSLPDWTPLRLRHRCKMEFLSVKGLSHLSKQGVNDVPTEMFEFCFELPSTWSRLNIPPGAAVAVKAHINGTDIIRHYTPISKSDTRGSVSLYLKALPDKGVMSRHLFFLRPGDTLHMMGPATFPKMQYAANGAKLYPEKMVMLAGGSGVAPMLHLIEDVIQRGVNCQMILLWGVENEHDLVFRKFLDHTQSAHPDKLKVVYCVAATVMAIRASHLHFGLIDSHLLHSELIPAFRPDGNKDVTVVICGPPKMSVAMMAALAHMGYHEDKVFSFNQ